MQAILTFKEEKIDILALSGFGGIKLLFIVVFPD
jgi:hypothetical protein